MPQRLKHCSPLASLSILRSNGSGRSSPRTYERSRSKVPSMLQAIDKHPIERQVRIATVAHAGYGNLHPLILMSDDDDSSRGAALLAFDDILTAWHRERRDGGR